VINRQTGMWIHHSGGSAEATTCTGDVLELVAAFEGIDRQRDFRRVMETAAAIAGIGESVESVELQRIREQRIREQQQYERERATKRAAAEAAVPAQWTDLARRSTAGEQYLGGRGIDARELEARDVVRFYPNGDPAVRLFALDDCRPVNIVRRQLRGSPKVLALPDCTTRGSIAGRIAELDQEGADVAIIVEGTTDALAAVLAFPGCVVLGANGTGKLAEVARWAAPKIHAARGWLLVAADNDPEGVSGAVAAVREAQQAGLELAPADAPAVGSSLIHLVDLGPHHDVADAWAAGVRWQWPARRTS
jgi:hypothetical protein